MLLPNIVITSLLLLLFSITGGEGITITVSEKGNHIQDSGDLILEDKSSSSCCSTGSCICHSFLQALIDLTSNVMVNITTDVVLSSIVPVAGIENIVIIGHNNPTINCNATGGMRFISSRNITIYGITWESCGSESSFYSWNSYPALEISNSSKVVVEYCTFQNSLGQALVFRDAMNDVEITHCNFSQNNYQDNGAVLHYSSQTNECIGHYLLIDNCNFMHNGRAESVIFLEGYACDSSAPVIIQNSKFIGNQGLPIYVTHHTVVITGNILIKDNNGGGIYTDHSSVEFAENSQVTFNNNTADGSGGAIHSSNYSTVLFKMASIIIFTENSATYFGGGGAIYSKSYSNISFQANCSVVFAENVAGDNGGAIFSADYSSIAFDKYSNVTFRKSCHFGRSFVLKWKFYGDI